jgi:UDP-glucose 4-epimerase
MDLAEGHLNALEFIGHETGWHTFNLGTGVSTTVLELVNEFESITHQKIPLKISSRRLGDLPAYYAKATKAKLLLGWVAKRSLADMCLTAWRWEEAREL